MLETHPFYNQIYYNRMGRVL